MNPYTIGIITFIIGLVVSSIATYRIINHNATKTQLTVTHNDTGVEYIVLGDVTNTTTDRNGLNMVLYGTINGQYFVRKTTEFHVKHTEKV